MGKNGTCRVGHFWPRFRSSSFEALSLLYSLCLSGWSEARNVSAAAALPDDLEGKVHGFPSSERVTGQREITTWLLPSRRQYSNNPIASPPVAPSCHPEERSDEGSAVA